MKKVYICSPLRGDLEKNIERAKGYCRHAVNAGAMPICSHVYCTQFLDDNIPEHRRKGMDIGLELLDICDELWYWPAEDGTISEGMKAEIARAEALRLPIKEMKL